MKTLFKGKIFTIPNCLTLVRLCLIPFLITAYVCKGNALLAAGILLLSGLTDVLDGFIARRYNMFSDLGKALDPLADKLTQISLALCLVFRFPLMIAMLVVLCVKEAFVASTHLILVNRSGKVNSARWHGKMTTVMLTITMMTHLLWAEIPQWLSVTLIALCICMIVLSGTLYGIEYITGIRRCKQSGDPKQPS